MRLARDGLQVPSTDTSLSIRISHNPLICRGPTAPYFAECVTLLLGELTITCILDR